MYTQKMVFDEFIFANIRIFAAEQLEWQDHDCGIKRHFIFQSVGWLVGWFCFFFPFSSLFLLLFAFFYSNSIALASMVSICGKNESIIRISHVGGMKSIQCMKRVHWWILKLMPYTYTRTYSYIYVKICRNKRAPFTYRGFVPHSWLFHSH